ncbi:MAG TPA: DoxX family membrane protein [Candidatus Cybelea sp.]
MRRVSRALLAVFFIAAGSNHFIHPALYARIVPPWLSAPALLVQISGACEILGGLGVLVAQLRRLAGMGLIALLIAVFPANLQMAAHPGLYAGLGNAPLFYLRLPLQLVLIAWVWWACLSADIPPAGR